MFTLVMFTPTDSMQYRPPKATQEVLKTNHRRSISDSLRGLGLELGLG